MFDYFCTEDTSFQKQILIALDKNIAAANGYELKRRLLDKVKVLKMWGDHAASKKIILDNLEEPEIRSILVDEKNQFSHIIF